MNIDVNEIIEIKDRLDSLCEDDALFIDEDGKTKYAIIPIDSYDKVEDLLDAINGDSLSNVKVVGGNSNDLTYEEYERIKSMIMDAVERTFKPKAEKLN